MRLQLSIERHTLPPTHILFSTASHPSAHTSSSKATIADLLLDVNELVPLESEDGEWGLEDYIVEVAATADQDNVYEALHFQSIKSVLREDDEVIVRYLKSEELKGRRYGGRLQITTDGRHLVDGVVWGKRLQGASSGGVRPGVEIPPRKKRRILATDDQIEMEAEEPLLAILEAEEEDENDESMDDNEIKIVSAFDDADDDDSGNDDHGIGDFEDDEVQFLLRDAAEVDGADLDESEAVLERQLKSRTRLGKRKRVIDEDSDDEAEFEGFSTPKKSPARRQVKFELGDTKTSEDTTGAAEAQLFSHFGDPDNNESSEYQSDSSSETSSSESDDESKGNSSAHSPPRISANGANLNSDTSSSGSSTSESNESDTSDDSSDSSSVSESEASRTSSSSEPESESDEEAIKTSSASLPKTAVSPNAKKTLQRALNKSPVTVFTPPGQGTAATRSKNQRNKLLKQLNRLKEEGLLSTNSNFEDLRAYLASTGQSQPTSTEEKSQLDAARDKALAAVEESEPRTSGGTAEMDSPEPSRDPESFQPTAESQAAALPASAELTDGSPQSGSGSSAKRSRLDVAASRRLLFGSLGLRAPRNNAEEQALREKFDKSAKDSPTNKFVDRHSGSTPEELNKDTTKVSWTEKLIISAVECTRDGMKLDPPPFPFEQYSTKRKVKAPPQELELDYGDVEPAEQPDMRFQDIPDLSERLKLKKLHGSLPNFTVRECYEALKACSWNHEKATGILFDAESSQPSRGKDHTQETRRAEELSNGSRTVSFAKDEVDGMPVPTDFEALADLEKNHLLPGAVIAYRELRLNPETFVPDVSPYRVARVTEFDGVEFVTFILAVKDRKKPRPVDPETGEVIVNDFEIRTSEDEEVDHGVRRMEFAQMRTPKLVEAGVQVSGSRATPNLRGGKAASAAQQSSEVVPDSVPSAQNKDSIPLPEIGLQPIEIDSPRRKELTTTIEEAGFNSSMDSGLLESLSSRAPQRPNSSQPEVYNDVDHSMAQGPSLLAIQQTSQAQTNTWSSSPRFPAQASISVEALEDDVAGLDSIQSTSSPLISPHLTVEYPHISQMDLDSSYQAPNGSSKNSSSHQDAQRVPGAPCAEGTLTTTEDNEQSLPLNDNGEVSHSVGDPAVEMLQSKVQESQPQEHSNLQAIPEPNNTEMTPRTNSFLGRHGVDGPASSPSYHDSNEENEMPNDASDDEISLPSLTEFTSSQRRKIRSKKSVLSERIFPLPVTRTGLRSNDSTSRIGKEKISSTPPRKLRNGYDSVDNGDLDLPPSSQPETELSIDPSQTDIKIASSQKEKQLSQIPLGTQVVDLTMSSDHVSQSNSDSEQGPRRRTATRAKKANGAGVPKAKGRKSMLGMSVSDVGAGARSGGGTGVGIGTRRFLTSKKSRSQI